MRRKAAEKRRNQKENLDALWLSKPFRQLDTQRARVPAQIKPLAKQVFVDDEYTNACQAATAGAQNSLLRMRNYSHLTDFLEPGRKSQQRKLAACN
jgi:hypothetical protein